jgi:hypothetical protein
MAFTEGDQHNQPVNRLARRIPADEATVNFWKAYAEKILEAAQSDQPQPEHTGNLMTPRTPGVPFFGRSRTASTEPQQ